MPAVIRSTPFEPTPSKLSALGFCAEYDCFRNLYVVCVSGSAGLLASRFQVSFALLTCPNIPAEGDGGRLWERKCSGVAKDKCWDIAISRPPPTLAPFLSRTSLQNPRLGTGNQRSPPERGRMRPLTPASKGSQLMDTRVHMI